MLAARTSTTCKFEGRAFVGMLISVGLSKDVVWRTSFPDREPLRVVRATVLSSAAEWTGMAAV